MKLISAFALSLVTLSLSAQAGEVLRLKATGPVKAESLQAFQLASSHSLSGLFIVQWKTAITESEKAESPTLPKWALALIAVAALGILALLIRAFLRGRAS